MERGFMALLFSWTRGVGVLFEGFDTHPAARSTLKPGSKIRARTAPVGRRRAGRQAPPARWGNGPVLSNDSWYLDHAAHSDY